MCQRVLTRNKASCQQHEGDQIPLALINVFEAVIHCQLNDDVGLTCRDAGVVGLQVFEGVTAGISWKDTCAYFTHTLAITPDGR